MEKAIVRDAQRGIVVIVHTAPEEKAGGRVEIVLDDKASQAAPGIKA